MVRQRRGFGKLKPVYPALTRYGMPALWLSELINMADVNGHRASHSANKLSLRATHFTTGGGRSEQVKQVLQAHSEGSSLAGH